MITREKEAKTVEAICVDFDGISLTSEEFKKVPNIRYLEMISGNLSGDFRNVIPELRWLSWKNCPSIFQATHFSPKELLILDISRTEITERWDGWTQLKVATRLKVLNLSFCRKLDTTPDLSAWLSLEILILENCMNLFVIHDSIRHLRSLKHLNLKGCVHLQRLPVDLDSLEALTELHIEQGIGFDISIREVPPSIGALVNLECLAIRKVNKLTTLPNSFERLKSLIELDVSQTKIAELPSTVVHLGSLKVLKINETLLQKLPESIGTLKKLEEIHGANCRKLAMIQNDIMRLPLLKMLKLTYTLVKSVPELPQSLVSLYLSSNATEEAPEISNLVNLKNLELSFSTETFRHRYVSTYSPYCILDLPKITSISSYLGCLCHLKELKLRNCHNLRQIGQLPSSLRKLSIRNCILLEVVDLSNLENLLDLYLVGPFSNIQGIGGLTSLQFFKVLYVKSSEFSGLERLENLRLIVIYCCPLLQTLPNLSNFKNLEDILLMGCLKLVEIQGLDKLESLRSLTIKDCRSLQSLPSPPNSKKLKEFDFSQVEGAEGVIDFAVYSMFKYRGNKGFEEMISLFST